MTAESTAREWREVRLGHHAGIKARLGWKGLKAEEYKASGYIFLAAPNLKTPEIDFDNVNFISERRYEESLEIALQVGDVLLVKDGSTLGISNLVRYLPAPATVNGSVAVIRARETLDCAFLHQYLKGEDFQKKIWTKKGGLGVPHLFQADLREFVIDLPPLPEQHRIAEILDTIDEAIRKTEQVIEKLKAMKQDLLHDLLTRGIDNNGELRLPPTEAPHLYKDSPLGMIPKGWEVEALGSHFAVKGGKRLPAGHTYSRAPTSYRYLRVLDFFGKAVSIDGLEHLPSQTFHALRRYEINDGNLYISIAGSIGHVGVYRSNGLPVRTILTENAARLVAQCEDVPDFVAIQANHNRVQRQISVEKGTGGGVPKLALFRIEKLLFAWPSTDEQNHITDYMQLADGLVDGEIEDSVKLRTLKRGLMDDLLTGRVRVKVEENE